MMPLRDETVHRQDDEDEGEEVVMPLRDETVHRQEVPEDEEALPLREETVHRHVPDPEDPEAESPAPANPALAALFDATVLARHREALDLVLASPADTAGALTAVEDAWAGVKAVSEPYEDSDPLLYNSLRRYMNALNVAMQRLKSIEIGPASTESVAINLAHEQVMGLGERLRDQLH